MWRTPTTSRRPRCAPAAAMRWPRPEFVRLTQADVWRLCAHLGIAGSGRRPDPGDLRPRVRGRCTASPAGPRARTWLLSIARRVCADAVRGAVRVRALPSRRERLAADPAEAVDGAGPARCAGTRSARGVRPDPVVRQISPFLP